MLLPGIKAEERYPAHPAQVGADTLRNSPLAWILFVSGLCRPWVLAEHLPGPGCLAAKASSTTRPALGPCRRTSWCCTITGTPPLCSSVKGSRNGDLLVCSSSPYVHDPLCLRKLQVDGALDGCADGGWVAWPEQANRRPPRQARISCQRLQLPRGTLTQGLKGLRRSISISSPASERWI